MSVFKYCALCLDFFCVEGATINAGLIQLISWNDTHFFELMQICFSNCTSKSVLSSMQTQATEQRTFVDES